MIELHFKRPRLVLGAAVAVAALTLAACGGGSHDSDSTTTPPVTVTPPVGVTLDGFITVVKGVIGMTSETAEPVAITDVTATASETAEPTPDL